MAVPAHTRLTFSGVFGSAVSPIEIWQFNLAFSAHEYGTEAARAAGAGAAANAWDNHMRSIFRDDVVLTRIRLAEIAPGGLVSRDAGGAYEQADWEGALPGTSVLALDPMPLQTALCVSLNTTRAGATGKGRFFLPCPQRTLDSSHIWAAASVEDFAEGYIGPFLRALNSASAIPGSLVVASAAAGVLSTVTDARVGRVPDTMRSRRSQLVEGYHNEAL